MMRELLTRVRFLLVRRSPAELDEELQFHLEQAAEANIAAGMDPEEARRQARILFGGVEAAREQSHEQKPGWWLGHPGPGCALRPAWLSPQSCVRAYRDRHTGIGNRRHHRGFQRGGSNSLSQPCLTPRTIVWYRSDWCNRSSGRSSCSVVSFTSGETIRSRLPPSLLNEVSTNAI